MDIKALFQFALIFALLLWPLWAALVGLGIEAYKKLNHTFSKGPLRFKPPFEKIRFRPDWEGISFRRLRPQ